MGDNRTEEEVILEKLNRLGYVLAKHLGDQACTPLSGEESRYALLQVLGPPWRDDFRDERDTEQLGACLDYALWHPKAGLPGHNLFMLVSRLVNKLNARKLD